MVGAVLSLLRRAEEESQAPNQANIGLSERISDYVHLHSLTFAHRSEKETSRLMKRYLGLVRLGVLLCSPVEKVHATLLFPSPHIRYRSVTLVK
jgi:hypothetical protein